MPPIEGPADAPSFDDAFAAAAASGGDIPAPGAPAPDAAPADGGAGGDGQPSAVEAPPAGDAPPAGGDPAAAPGETSAGGEPAPAAPAAPEPAPAADPNAAPAPTADEIVKGLAELLKQDPAAKPAPAAQPQEQPIYSAEDIQTLQEYESNWPDVAKAEALRRKAEYHDLLKYVFEQIQTFVGPTIEQVRLIQNNLHTGELKTLVPDYDPALEEKVTSWIDQQPAYLQGPFRQVMQTGTSEEVADLIGRYRAATGTSAPAAPAAAAPAPAAAPKAELSKVAKQAAASLAPVSGDRSAVPQGEDPQDYDSAFVKYAAQMPGI